MPTTTCCRRRRRRPSSQSYRNSISSLQRIGSFGFLLLVFFFLAVALSWTTTTTIHAFVLMPTPKTTTTTWTRPTGRTTNHHQLFFASKEEHQQHYHRHVVSQRPIQALRTSRRLRITSPSLPIRREDSGCLILQQSTSSSQDNPSSSSSPLLVGDDAAYFSFQDQKLDEWIKFTVATGTVLALVAYVWFLPIGWHGGDWFLHNFVQQGILQGSTDPGATMFVMLSIFAICHSGLAGLRTYAEPIVGSRPWRVLFALVSLPLALSCISFFVNHAHDGVQLWQLVPTSSDTTAVATYHAVLWMINFVSFLFLYPSSFNLLEIAAIQPPQLHLYETGITRITRHPQAIGQIMWCVAHTAWLGTSTAVAASTVLIGHHVFSMYHGDRRLANRHGEAFDYIKSKTSIVPFQAIWEGRQELPAEYWKEFLRGPYAIVVAGTVGAYLAHPWMQAGAALLNW